MDNLGRYYTQELFSKLLISQFRQESPSSIIDIGVGGGSLIKAASDRWKYANFYAADIDKTMIPRTRSELPFINIYYANSLSKDIEKIIGLKIGTVDIAVCNPPFLSLKNNKKYHQLLEDANLKECISLKRLTSDIVFLAQNLRLLKDKGELGIILPDSLITSHDFEIFRQSLLINHSIRNIIELPEKIFPKTEARTHILILEKGSSTIKNVRLYISDKKGGEGCVRDVIEQVLRLHNNWMDSDAFSW